MRTSFRWRHRFLAAPSWEQPALMSGIVEADETFFRRSFKGLHVWGHPGEGIILSRPARPPPGRAHRTARDAARRADARARHARLPTQYGLRHPAQRTIGSCLKPMLAPDAVLCIDTAAVYSGIARETGLYQEPVNISAGERVRDHAFHLQKADLTLRSIYGTNKEQ
ncbi:hypothetical protein LU298_09765 [Komagataeibacter intermedius]|nr:hypothetical protein [Komagataeibacter intermedius]